MLLALLQWLRESNLASKVPVIDPVVNNYFCVYTYEEILEVCD